MVTSTVPAVPDHAERALPHPDPRMPAGESSAPSGARLRIAATSGAALLLLMWLATWPPATIAAEQPTGSTNPLVDDHIIAALAIIVVGGYAAQSSGSLGRWWSNQPLVRRSPRLRCSS